MKISVIMPTYNKVDRLSLSLKSMSEQTIAKDDFEVVLVDDGSIVNIQEVYQRYTSDINIKYIRLEHLGRAIARNVAIDNANGELIVFTDDDAICEPDFLQFHWKHYKNYGTSVLLGKRKKVYWGERTIQNLVAQRSTNCIQFIHDSKIREDTYEAVTRRIFCGQEKCLCDIVWICSITANMSLTKESLLDVGKFEIIYQGWGLEDIDLGYRLKQKGIDFYYNPNVLNYHMEHSRDRKQMLEDIKRNMKTFYYRYKDPDILLYWDFFKGDIGIQDLVLHTQNDERVINYFKRQISNEKLKYFVKDFKGIVIK